MSLLSTGRQPSSSTYFREREQSEALRLLDEMRRNRTGLSVFSLGGRFISLVLEIHPEQSCLLLDELVPSHGHDAMQPGITLAVEARLDGVQVNFECEVLELDEDDKGCFYRVTLPPAIKRRQRRQYHRVPAAARHLRARLSDDEGNAADGEIVDVSASGIAVRVSLEDATGLAHVDGELDCRLILDADETLQLKLGICRVIDQGAAHSRLLAGRFLHLTPGMERRLGQLVSELEREMVRKRPPGQEGR